MHISDLHDYGENAEQQKVAEPFLHQGQRKRLTSEIEDIVNSEFDRLDEYAAEHLSQVAAGRAERFLERVLAGDDKAAMALLGDSYGSDRVRLGGCDEGEPWASIIHGRLFETGGIAMRRKIVEAYPDLLISERIKDLESVVEGLTQQIATLQRRLDERF